MPRDTPKRVSKKRKFVRDGVFFTELNEFFEKELADDGYTGCNVRVTPSRTEIIIRSTSSQLDKVAGKEERRIRELTALVQKRFDFKPGSLICIAGTLKDQSLSALVQAQAVKFKLLEGLSVRRAAYSVLKFIKDKGAKGCEVVVSGKLRGQRAKAMKFREGYMIHAGDAVNYYIDEAVKHVHLRQGVLGIKVKIMLPSASEVSGGEGVERELPDKIELPVLKELPADQLLRKQIRDRELANLQEAEAAEQEEMAFQEEFAATDAMAPTGGAPMDDAGVGGYVEYGGVPEQAGYGQPADQVGYGAPPVDQAYGAPREYGAPVGAQGGYDAYQPPQDRYPPAGAGPYGAPAQDRGYQGGPPGGYPDQDFRQY